MEQQVELPSSAILIRSLTSELCPSCSGKKKERHTLCGGCYARLPGKLKRDLYNRIGEGYEAALSSSFEALRVTEPHWF